jgi:hypothetical protein
MGAQPMANSNDYENYHAAKAVARGGRASTAVQSILLPRRRFPTYEKARIWASANGFLTNAVELEPLYIRFIQQSSRDFVDGLWYTKTLGDGVLLKLGHPLRSTGAKRRERRSERKGEGEAWKRAEIERDIARMDAAYMKAAQATDEEIAASLQPEQVRDGISNVLRLRGRATALSTVRKLRSLRPDLDWAINEAMSSLKLRAAEARIMAQELRQIDEEWERVLAPRMTPELVETILSAPEARPHLALLSRRIKSVRPDLAATVDRIVEPLLRGS